MKKIELEIIAISHSITQTQSYAVVLGEVNGIRRLPIIIGGFEAQAIAVALEKMNPSRPLTHDLMKNFMTAFGIEVRMRSRSSSEGPSPRNSASYSWALGST